MMHTHQGRKSSHPWYYLLGGKRLSLKEIREEARASSYQGYLSEEINSADRLPEPQRSEALRGIRSRALASLARDASRYRVVCRELSAHRAAGLDQQPSTLSGDVHRAVSLKHNHLYNDFAHLSAIDELLSRQLDLFGF